jgi:hypothetical protein
MYLVKNIIEQESAEYMKSEYAETKYVLFVNEMKGDSSSNYI